MKLIHTTGERFQFEIGGDEKVLLFHLVQQYPLVPASHHRLSQDRQIPDREENQHLLDEALSAQRLENRKHIESLLNEPQRFAACPAGYRVSFTRGELEWLLQVINDVRLGSWLALGSPDPQAERQQRRQQPGAQHGFILDLAGYFEMELLSAVSGDRMPGHE